MIYNLYASATVSHFRSIWHQIHGLLSYTWLSWTSMPGDSVKIVNSTDTRNILTFLSFLYLLLLSGNYQVRGISLCVAPGMTDLRTSNGIAKFEEWNRLPSHFVSLSTMNSSNGIPDHHSIGTFRGACWSACRNFLGFHSLVKLSLRLPCSFRISIYPYLFDSTSCDIFTCTWDVI